MSGISLFWKDTLATLVVRVVDTIYDLRIQLEYIVFLLFVLTPRDCRKFVELVRRCISCYEREILKTSHV